jgi:uncharacterized membrane protein required for colicin V production
MCAFDFIVFVVLAGFAVYGSWKGMVSQFVSVGSLIVCWIIASRFAFILAPSIPAKAPWNNIGAMIILFAATMVGIWFLHGWFEKKLKDWHLQKLNKLLGGVLGFIKGLAICMIVTFFCVTLCESTRLMVFQSSSGTYLVNTIQNAGAFLPKDGNELLNTQLALFNAQIDGNMQQPSEEDTIKKMLGEKSAEANDFLAKSSSLLGEAKNLQSQLQSQSQGRSNGAVSLLDAIAKFFKGEKTATDSSTAASTAPLIPKDSGVTVSIPKENPLPTTANNPAELFAQPSSMNTANTAKTVLNSPSYQEDIFFSRPASSIASRLDYVPPTMSELTSITSKADAEIFNTMSIPQSAPQFRLPADTPIHSPQPLLNNAGGSSKAPAATLFNPKR